MDELETRRGPGRPPRSVEVKAQRRRRGDETLSAAKRLPIPPEVKKRLDEQGLTGRWVNDIDNRMHQLTKLDDYDIVEGVAPVPVGTAPDGTPIKAHLLAKPRAFIEEDRAKAEKRRGETESSLLRGQLPQSAGSNPRPAQGGDTYADKANAISRVNQVLE